MRKVVGLLSFILLIESNLFAQNLIINGDFGAQSTNWNFVVLDSAAANFSFVPYMPTANNDSCLKVQVLKKGINTWSVQLSAKSDYSTQKYSKYKTTFKVRGSKVGLKITPQSQNVFWYGKSFLIDTAYKFYSFEFVSETNSLRFKINFEDTGTYFVDSISVVSVSEPAFVPLTDSLRKYANLRNINFGAAISPLPLLSSNRYRSRFAEQFSGLVPENHLKMGIVMASKSAGLDFTYADTLVNFAIANNQYIRGHALLWYNSLPQWVADEQMSADSLTKFLRNYITTVVSRYKGKIKEWDVLNEHFSDNGPLHSPRQTVFTQLLGPSIIDSIFIWAHRADSSALLFYNDYSIENKNSKSDVVLQFLNSMRSRGVPVHGVGFQSHFEYNFSNSFLNSIDQNVKRFTDAGFLVSFTEVDLAISGTINTSKYITQAQNYRKLLTLALKHSPKVKSFFLWGFTDLHSWIPNFWATYGQQKDDALIFDRNYAPKPAYDSLITALKTQPIAGLEPTNQDLLIDIYPNPTQSVFNIVSNDLSSPIINYTIYNIQGSIIERGTIYYSATIGENIDNAGIYILKLENKYNNKSYKIIKE